MVGAGAGVVVDVVIRVEIMNRKLQFELHCGYVQ